MHEFENLSSDKINLIKHIYEWNQQLAHFADIKVNVFQVVNTLIISFAATFSVRDLSSHAKIIIVAAIVLAAFSSLMLLLTILPRASKANSSGVTFYKGILKFSRENYCSRMAQISIGEILESYLSSIYTIASIEEKKFTRLRLAFVSSFIAIALVGSAIILNILLFPK